MDQKFNFYRIASLFIPLTLLAIESCNAQNQETQVGEVIVEKVITSGIEDDYTFSVTLRSPDQGCQQYADWWEVISIDGDLIYRRILMHSHVDEQPFTRSGGKVKIKADQEVIVRAHMNNSGYGSQGMKGSAAQGFQNIALPAGFAANVETKDPLPSGCAF